MRSTLISLTVYFSLLTSARAAAHRLSVHSNPSIEIFSIAKGPDGFLWLAAADGLYRFDGLHYSRVANLPFVSPQFVGFTRDGTLWCAGFQGLARLMNGQFQILLNEEVRGMAVYPDHVFVTVPRGLAHLGLNGAVTRLPYGTRRDLSVDSTGLLDAVCVEPSGACSIDPGHPGSFTSTPLPSGYEFQEALFAPAGDLWAADDHHAVRVRNGQAVQVLERLRSLEMRRPAPLVSGNNGQIWFLGETIRGLSPEVEFRYRPDHARYLPASGFEDDRHHLWVSSTGEGLLEWVQQPDWERWFPQDFANEPAVLTLRDRRGPVVATHANLYRLDPASRRWSPIASDKRRYEGLLPLDHGGFLAATQELGLVRLSPDGAVVERIADLPPKMDAYRKLLRDRKGRVWAGSKRALLRVEGDSGSLKLRAESLPDVPPGKEQQAVDLELGPDGRLWVGYAYGIAWLDERDQWHKLATDQPVTDIRSFTLAGDDIWVAHRRPGSFSRLHASGDHWQVSVFPAAAGYGPVDTDFVHSDSRGWIWRGTSGGVYISDGIHFQPSDWLHIHPGNGLATSETGQYGFFEDSDSTVWISGDEGVTHFRPAATWFESPRTAPAPRVTRVDADGHAFLTPASFPDAFAKSTKVIRIEVGTLEAPPFREYPLRYRLLPRSQQWQLSRDGVIEFQDLPPNRYTLEAGYAGNGESAVGAYPFRIGTGNPASGWLWLIGPLLAAGALAFAIRYFPWFEGLRFRIEKSVFLLRRRFGKGASHSPVGAMAAPTDYSGEILGERYQVGRVLSRGGFSTVYEGRDLDNANARIAVKVLNRGARDEGWVRDRFAHEVASLRSVEHPCVVRVLDSWISPAGEPCLAMPFLDGPTLRAALGAGQDVKPFEPRRVGRIVRALGAALAEVHRHGIVHRDLKPENLILLHHEQPVVLDFGTAGLRSVEHELTATTLIAGSFHYMAPERLMGRYSPASDIFSFAVMILEMLTGKRLGDLQAMFSDASFVEEIESLLRARICADAARKLARILGPAFDSDPRARPAAVEAWSAEVAAVLDQT